MKYINKYFNLGGLNMYHFESSPMHDMNMMHQHHPMHDMNMMHQHHPMLTMPQHDLESMYPNIYFIILPHIEHHCNMLESQHGKTHHLTHDMLDSIVDDIYKKVEPDLIKCRPENELIEEDTSEEAERQVYPHGGVMGRNLIRILLIRELLRRRAPHTPYGYNMPLYTGFPMHGFPYGVGQFPQMPFMGFY